MGTGKTYIARAVATENNAHTVFLSGPKLMTEDSEDLIQSAFLEAKLNAPSIVIIDEIDFIRKTEKVSEKCPNIGMAESGNLKHGIAID